MREMTARYEKLAQRFEQQFRGVGKAELAPSRRLYVKPEQPLPI
jgi:hypothetical protein